MSSSWRPPRDRNSRVDGTSPRQRGQSPRQLGTNPRAVGTNTIAGTAREIARIQAARTIALEVIRRAGVTWCATCGDGGTLETGEREATPCACRPIPADRAARIAARFGHHVTHGGRAHVLEAPGVHHQLERMLHRT